MASHNESYRAGELKGQTEEKAKQMAGSVGDKAREAKDWTGQTAQAAKEKAGQTAQAAKEKGSEATQKTGETTKAGPGILQQTGDQVKQMATTAADAVKSTLGMGKNEDIKK
ncbi:hypothetical protein UlMin_017318 [Ulmus minor]